MSHCPFCNTALALSKAGYDAHIQRYHSNVTPVLRKKLIPVNTSGRTKAQIVAAMETQFKMLGVLVQ